MCCSAHLSNLSHNYEQGYRLQLFVVVDHHCFAVARHDICYPVWQGAWHHQNSDITEILVIALEVVRMSLRGSLAVFCGDRLTVRLLWVQVFDVQSCCAHDRNVRVVAHYHEYGKCNDSQDGGDLKAHFSRMQCHSPSAL